MEESHAYGTQRSRKSSKSHHGKDAPSSSSSTHVARTSSHIPSSTLGMIDSMWPCKACRAADAICKWVR